MFTTIAIIWLWITIAVLAIRAGFLLGRFGAKLTLATIMIRQWKREETR